MASHEHQIVSRMECEKPRKENQPTEVLKPEGKTFTALLDEVINCYAMLFSQNKSTNGQSRKTTRKGSPLSQEVLKQKVPSKQERLEEKMKKPLVKPLPMHGWMMMMMMMDLYAQY
jgi:hypothetical protein